MNGKMPLVDAYPIEREWVWVLVPTDVDWEAPQLSGQMASFNNDITKQYKVPQISGTTALKIKIRSRVYNTTMTNFTLSILMVRNITWMLQEKTLVTLLLCNLNRYPKAPTTSKRSAETIRKTTYMDWRWEVDQPLTTTQVRARPSHWPKHKALTHSATLPSPILVFRNSTRGCSRRTRLSSKKWWFRCQLEDKTKSF